MGELSDFARGKLVDHVFKAAYPPVATLYLALCTTLPVKGNTGSNIVETDYPGYARKSFIGNSFFGAAGATTLREIIQAAEIELAQATGPGTSDINSWAIVDSETGGNMLAFGGFTGGAWNVVSGNTPKIPAGELGITIGGSAGAGFSNYTAHKMLDLMFRNVAWTSPKDSLYAGLVTAVVADSDTTISELSGNNYGRVQILSASINAASAGATTSNAPITFPTPSGAWATFTSLVVMDASSGGNLLGTDNTNVVDQPAASGDTVKVDAGNFNIALT